MTIAAAWVVISAHAVFAQSSQVPGNAQSVPTAPTGGVGAKPPRVSARIAGRILAADTGKPLARVSVTLVAQPTKTTRFTETDANGRYEFLRLVPGRYNVRPDKGGYLFISADPFALGVGVDLAESDNADRIDFTMSRASVITGRITDEFGEPVAGLTVFAVRYQFRPGGQRELVDGTFGNFVMPSATNDRGEFRIFGLKPGSYYVSAKSDLSQAVPISQAGAGISGVDSDEGVTSTYYPGTANVADAQPVRVELSRDTNASFALTSARMARITGTIHDSRGQPVPAGARVLLRQAKNVIGFSESHLTPGPDGTFAIANVAPGDYILEVRPGLAGPGALQGSSLEHAAIPLTVSGDDITDLRVITRTGVSVSGRVIFEGKSEIAQPDLRISAVDEAEARNVVSYSAPDAGRVAPDGQFFIRSVSGRVLFRTGPLPQSVMLKAVRVNGVDITNTPYDATTSENIEGLEVVLVDKQSRLIGFVKNAQGEHESAYRLIVYPANLRPGDVGVRFQHNASPVNGQTTINRMPPGEYVGLAVKGVQPGEEWDPDLRKRIEQLGRRFTLKEGDTLELEFPIVE